MLYLYNYQPISIDCSNKIQKHIYTYQLIKKVHNLDAYLFVLEPVNTYKNIVGPLLHLIVPF